jgi:hypothetical protein
MAVLDHSTALRNRYGSLSRRRAAPRCGVTVLSSAEGSTVRAPYARAPYAIVVQTTSRWTAQGACFSVERSPDLAWRLSPHLPVSASFSRPGSRSNAGGAAAAGDTPVAFPTQDARVGKGAQRCRLPRLIPRTSLCSCSGRTNCKRQPISSSPTWTCCACSRGRAIPTKSAARCRA